MRTLILILVSPFFIGNVYAQVPDYFNNSPQWSTSYEFPGVGEDPYQDKNIYFLDGNESEMPAEQHFILRRRYYVLTEWCLFALFK